MLHHGMPDLKKSGELATLTGASLDGNKRIPAAVVHFRLDKHGQVGLCSSSILLSMTYVVM